MNTINKRVDWIIEKAECLGYDCDRQYARTGTCYIECSALINDDLDVVVKKIRVADHADAYGSSDYTADDCEGSDKGAVEYLANLLKKTYKDSFKKRVSFKFAVIDENDKSWNKAFKTLKSAEAEIEEFKNYDECNLKIIKLKKGNLPNGGKPVFFER